jgi:ribose-phosphate pyrophosphokinase
MLGDNNGGEGAMILFASETHRPMAAALEETAGLETRPFCAKRFENGELHVEVRTSVTREHCLVLGSIAPPDGQMLSVLLLAHTLKKEGARRVTAILPYLAYARDDKDKPGESLATAWAGALACASGIDEIITVDVHSERAKKLFPMPVQSLSPAEIFAEALTTLELRGATIVAPDNGAIGRCQAVRAAAGMALCQIPHFEKRRTAMGIIHGGFIGAGLVGKVERQVVLVDDILDTGGTLLSACEKLREAGVDDISILVTHGLFTGDRWKKLSALGVKRIVCTDSVPLPEGVDARGIVRLSVVPLLERALRVLANGDGSRPAEPSSRGPSQGAL